MRDRCFISLAGAIGLTAILPVVLPAQSLAWRIDPLRSSARFSAAHNDLNLAGHFGGVKGTVIYDPANPAASSVEATIDCSTVKLKVAGDLTIDATSPEVALDIEGPTPRTRKDGKRSALAP